MLFYGDGFFFLFFVSQGSAFSEYGCLSSSFSEDNEAEPMPMFDEERDMTAGEVQPKVASNSCVTITKLIEVNERTQVTEVPVIAPLEVGSLEAQPAKKRKIQPSVETKGVKPIP